MIHGDHPHGCVCGRGAYCLGGNRSCDVAGARSRSTAAARAGAQPGQADAAPPPSSKKAVDAKPSRKAARPRPRQQDEQAASGPNGRRVRTRRLSQPAPKAARANSRTAANRSHAAAGRPGRQQCAARSPPYRPARSIRTAVVPYLTVSRPVLRRGTQRAAGHCARSQCRCARRSRDARPRFRFAGRRCCPGGATTACKPSTTEAPRPRAKCSRRPRCGSPPTLAGRRPTSRRRRLALAVDEAIEVADAGEVNEIDLAAESAPGAADADLPAIAAGADRRRGRGGRRLGAAAVRLDTFLAWHPASAAGPAAADCIFTVRALC